MKTSILPLALPAVEHIARNMRPDDAREIYCTRWTDDPHDLARDAMRSRFGCVVARGEPVAAIGAVAASPGVFCVWMFATHAWPRVALTATKWALRSLKPTLLANGHRAETRSIEDHHRAHAWLSLLGFRAECKMPDVGRNRETFIQYAWRLSDVQCQSAGGPEPVRRPAQPFQYRGQQEGFDTGRGTGHGADHG